MAHVFILFVLFLSTVSWLYLTGQDAKWENANFLSLCFTCNISRFFFFQNSRNHRILHILDYRVYLVITSSHLSVVACTLHRVLIPYRPDVTCTKRFHTILTGVRIQPKSEGFHTVLRVGHSGYLSHDTPFFLFFLSARINSYTDTHIRLVLDIYLSGKSCVHQGSCVSTRTPFRVRDIEQMTIGYVRPGASFLAADTQNFVHVLCISCSRGVLMSFSATAAASLVWRRSAKHCVRSRRLRPRRVGGHDSCLIQSLDESVKTKCEGSFFPPHYLDPSLPFIVLFVR